jgi:16S rRNA (uracil1498-N3)-methyltransferase
VSAHVHRFFVAGEHAPGETVALDPGDRRHVERVLRLRPGADFEVVDAAGGLFAAVLVEGGGVRLAELLAPPARGAAAPTVWLGLAGARADVAVEKLTELGVAAIGALRTDRGRGEPRLERWQRLAAAAARQSKRRRLPQLLGPAGLGEIAFDERAVLLDHEAPDAVAFAARRDALLLVGPEAGWSERERDLARAAGVPLARLGEGQVLRSETAAIAAAALALLATVPA